MNKFKEFSNEELKLLSDALWLRQRCFIAGDKRFKQYGEFLNQISKLINYVPSRS
jgi:hypothetical protein